MSRKGLHVENSGRVQIKILSNAFSQNARPIF